MVKLTWQGYVRLCQFTLEGLDVGGGEGGWFGGGMGGRGKVRKW